MKRLILLSLLLPQLAFAQNYADYVNTFIGTGGHGHTYPGATLPFGMVQLSPDTRPDGYNDWDGCGGYHYSDSIIYGFSHTHLSGTGVADYCDILLMPTSGAPLTNNIINNNPKLGYASSFSHNNEKAGPGYYQVLLEDDKINVELTATTRVGLHQYQFQQPHQNNVILDLTHRDLLLEGSYIEVISPTKIQGLRRSSSWAKDQWLYFAIEFSQPFSIAALIDSTKNVKTASTGFTPIILSGTELKSYFTFNNLTNNTLQVKCAISAVSCNGAWKNMQAELPHWDFNKVKNEANYIWNYELSKIAVSSAVDEAKSKQDPSNNLVVFYTALYHCMLAPNIYEDVDDQYRGRDNTIHVSSTFDNYTVFSLWDTFRALHPLLSIIDQSRTNHFINTFITQYEQGGRLPVWELSANETECMIGYHAVSVMADAAVKGIRDYDINKAYAAMKHSANLDHFGLSFYKEKGFIESNDEPESVSKTFEYSYNDWCIAQMARITNAPADEIAYYDKRATNYLNLLDKGLARPRFNGGWYEPYNPTEVNFNFTEANAWQYSFFYPQHTPSGPLFEKRLNELFTTNTGTTGRQQSDITGLIGQYAHGNEPSHNYAYLFNYTSTPYKTQFYTNQIMSEFYKNAPDGLIGNEDCGQMSAWYVMSAMGLYQVSPGKPTYDFGAALFDKVVIQLENNKKFTITTKNRSAGNYYLSLAKLNGQPITEFAITHEQLMAGGNLEFVFSSTKNLSAKKEPVTNQPISAQAPIILGPGNSFTETADIIISTQHNKGSIIYTINGGPEKTYVISDKPLIVNITISSVITAKYCNETMCSGVATAKFTKRDNNYVLIYNTNYSTQYTAGGNTALIDGLRGGSDFRTGMWQGWWGENMEVVLDCGKVQTFTSAGAGFLQDVRSWVWVPKALEIYTSIDGKNYTLLTTINNNVSSTNYDSKEIQNLTTTFPETSARYIKFKAINFGTIPDWHPGKGNNSWVFCDEVWVK
jgi:predicted alpha-1,2-mannosidase